jgi:PIN domain nuclease of toxin-antitoxin system
MTSGRLKITGAVDAFAEEIASRFVVIPMSPKIAMLAARFLAPYPRDPADRLIGATAVAEGIALITKDRDIRSGGQVKTIW